MFDLQSISRDVAAVARELVETGGLGAGQLIVIGVSTSEVAGQKIGTSGSLEIAEQIYRGLDEVRRESGCVFAFQCCEHLNRALVIDRSVAEQHGWDPVAAIPVPQAGGAMSAYAYRTISDPCLVETIAAHAGIDIGDTLIGMHLRRVAVPVRPTLRQIGAARVTMATTRPKLIGGARAVYMQTEADERC